MGNIGHIIPAGALQAFLLGNIREHAQRAGGHADFVDEGGNGNMYHLFGDFDIPFHAFAGFDGA